METIIGFCVKCRLQTRLDVHSRVNVDMDENVLIALCPECRRPFMFMEDGHGYDRSVLQVYPEPRDANRIPEHLPLRIQKMYSGALTCMAAGVPEAAATMVGKCIEAIGRDRGARATDRDGLFVIIDRMVVQGVLTQKQGEVAHLLRGLRNDGAHDTDFEITAEDAEDAIKLLEMLCLSIYTIHQGFAELKQRREQARLPGPVVPAPVGEEGGEDIPF